MPEINMICISYKKYLIKQVTKYFFVSPKIWNKKEMTSIYLNLTFVLYSFSRFSRFWQQHCTWLIPTSCTRNGERAVQGLVPAQLPQLLQQRKLRMRPEYNISLIVKDSLLNLEYCKFSDTWVNIRCFTVE